MTIGTPTMGAGFAIGARRMGAGFAIAVSTIGPGVGFAIGATAIGAGFAIGVSTMGPGAGFAIGVAAIGAGFAIGASAIGRDIGRATLSLGVGIGVGFGFRLGLEVDNFGKLGIAPCASGILGASGDGSFVMRGISNDRVPLAVRLGTAGICLHRGTFVAAAALAAGEATTAASTL